MVEYRISKSISSLNHLLKSFIISIEKIKEKRDQDIYQTRTNEPDPDCPPDHTKVDNNQRISTLEQLQFSKSY
jgi:hypothetical protein